jgi:Heterokaryon incompatibility protein (HET)
MSTTCISLQKKKPEIASFEAMKINQQLKVLKGWLRNCDNRSPEDDEEIHEYCQKDKDLAIPAKRVLNLADVATGKVRLVETANLKGRYVALSHCWGDPKRHPIMSTHATLKDHLSGIKISSLPRSFLDAIKVCVFLHIQYIWIDCLCIVQDDKYGRCP